MLTPNGQAEQARVRAAIQRGPVNASTTDEEIKARARVFGHDLAVPYQILEHIMFLERRLSRLEGAPHLANVEKRG
jgi:hypothetical protein